MNKIIVRVDTTELRGERCGTSANTSWENNLSHLLSLLSYDL